MSKMQHPDINDDQIRFISSTADMPGKRRFHSHKVWRMVLAATIVIAIGVVAYIYYKVTSTKEDISVKIEEAATITAKTVSADTIVKTLTKAYTVVTDTTIDGHKFTIFTPVGGKPELAIGGEVLSDTTATLIVQAADIRSDNGKIVGACVSKGNLISIGQSKAGFCAIIGANITIGVADATSYLEQALDVEGDFFRQYPLVVGNQIVENKPKGESFRKALAELNGKIVVIISRDKMTFHDFSQSLVDLGVSNAIYLVGSKAYGFAKKEDGTVVSFGTKTDNLPENISFLVWRN